MNGPIYLKQKTNKNNISAFIQLSDPYYVKLLIPN